MKPTLKVNNNHFLCNFITFLIQYKFIYIFYLKIENSGLAEMLKDVHQTKDVFKICTNLIGLGGDYFEIMTLYVNACMVEEGKALVPNDDSSDNALKFVKVRFIPCINLCMQFEICLLIRSLF